MENSEPQGKAKRSFRNYLVRPKQQMRMSLAIVSICTTFLADRKSVV